MGDIFKDCIIHVNPLGFGKNRLALFAKQIKDNRGTYLSEINEKSLSSVTHIAVETDCAKDAVKDLTDQYNKNKFHQNLIVLKINWIIDSLKAKNRLGETLYKIYTPSNSNKRKLEDSIPVPNAPSTSKPKLTENIVDLNLFACAHASSHDTQKLQVPNQQIIDELKKLGEAFKAKGDTWRSYAYVKAISAIKTYNKEIVSYDEARTIPGLGDGMASKIWELLETGQLRRRQEVCEAEDVKVLELFNGVWGAGPKTAQNWYSLGYRSLEDLKTKATLTSQQKIGLKHYDDIQAKIPREEVTKIAKTVEREAKCMFPNLQVEVCGSYRRGKMQCGDIDIVMSHPEKDISTALLLPLVNKLKDTGFITDSLVNIEEEGNHKKFFGLCRLSEEHRHRRLDLFVIPWHERGPALLHYTGSALFNRSIRLLAQKKDMSLTQHALHGVAIRNGREKIATGEALYTPTEESVFEHLGLPYRPPEDRDH